MPCCCQPYDPIFAGLLSPTIRPAPRPLEHPPLLSESIPTGGTQASRDIMPLQTRKNLLSVPGGPVAVFFTVETGECGRPVFRLAPLAVCLIALLQVMSKLTGQLRGRDFRYIRGSAMP